MQNCEWNPPKWTTKLQCPGHEKMIVAAILLFIQIVGIQPHIWVPFLHSYQLFPLCYIQRVLAYMQNCEWNPPKWTTKLQCPGHEKMLVAAILLFIWIVGIQPHIWVPFLHSYQLFLLGYIQRVLAHMQNSECNPLRWTTNIRCPGHEKMIVAAILLFIQIVGIQPHIWVPFLHSYQLFLLGYIQRVLAYMQNSECNPPRWTTNYGVLGMERW
jgi:hypothetical protein